jgi:beta-lactamase regulating signal transducer with metallopeptidase domain
VSPYVGSLPFTGLSGSASSTINHHSSPTFQSPTGQTPRSNSTQTVGGGAGEQVFDSGNLVLIVGIAAGVVVLLVLAVVGRIVMKRKVGSESATPLSGAPTEIDFEMGPW